MIRSLTAALLVLALRAESSAQLEPFVPSRSVWSVYSSNDIPEDPPASAEELAPSLQLRRLGPDEQGFEIWEHQPTAMKFVFVPGGMVSIGSDHQAVKDVQGKTSKEVLPAEQPRVEVYVSPFFIGLYEVTNAQYRSFLDAAERGEVQEHEYPFGTKEQQHEPLYWDEPEWGFQQDDQPVAGVHFISAFAMSRWMGGRLPTECEWEKACRGTDARTFPWGNEWDHTRANTDGSRNGRTSPVGMYPGGRSPYGCWDMIGNVTEYVHDPWEAKTYRYFPKKDPCLLERNDRDGRQTAVSRGGCWNALQGAYIYCRSSARCREYPTRWIAGIIDPASLLWSGIRVVLSPHQDLYPEGWFEAERARIEAEQQNDPHDDGPQHGGSDPSDRR